MFDVMSWAKMFGTYEERKVDRYEDDDLIVDTCLVLDAAQDYETGVVHPDYNDGAFVIVESYPNKDKAAEGHAKWVQIMTTEPLPGELIDCCNSSIGALAAEFGCETRFPRTVAAQ